MVNFFVDEGKLLEIGILFCLGYVFVDFGKFINRSDFLLLLLIFFLFGV